MISRENKAKIARWREGVVLGDLGRVAHSSFPLVLLLFSLCAGSFASATDRLWVGDSIPRTIHIGTSFIVAGSDSLRLNDRLLQHGVDYEFEPRRQAFVLEIDSVTLHDTLRVRYQPAPGWLRLSYGHQLPPEMPPDGLRESPGPAPVRAPAAARAKSDVTISGAKSVRFSARSGGASEFGQSLDMKIEGMLADNLEVVGSVSDRGYDPSYGTANSRLSELDKINLLLTSPAFTAEVGDISLPPALATQSGRRVSGVSAVVSKARWSLQGLVARPKGRFTTTRFYGRDDLQGPYQITAQGPTQAIVPASETVWLDGQRLERGSSNDYIIDYPTGRITFAVNHPIDSRSRIEIDYEPLATEYRGEMFGGAASASFGDSLVTIETQWMRDGDDPDQRLAAALSDTDREALRFAGDSRAQRSGIITDTAGDYNLVVDSLPDSVFQYAGAGQGEYSLTFSYVGQGEGAYQYIGGDVYVWSGEGNGEYLPIVSLTPPERTDYYRVTAGLRQQMFGEVVMSTEQTVYDRNLFSPIDDADNDGGLYDLKWRRTFDWNNRDNRWSYEFRRREAQYEGRRRINPADFAHEYLLPDLAPGDYDESFQQADLSLWPISGVVIKPNYSRLQYDGEYEGTRGGVRTEINLSEALSVAGGAAAVRTRLTGDGEMPEGRIDNQEAEVRYDATALGLFGIGWKHDERQHNYDGFDQGTRFHEWAVYWRTGGESVRLEYHDEDSLLSGWQLLTDRRRLVLNSRRSIGPLGYDATVSQQWLERSSGRERSFMGRLSYSLRSTAHGLSVAGSYLISNETRQARGLTYIEVQPGQGDYIRVDGQYIPDPDGNYLQVEEILSEQARVRRGEKSFRLHKRWPWGRIGLNAEIEEELLDDGDREWWWIVPVASDPDQPYLYYRRRYRAEAHLWPVRGWHAINYLVEQNRQQRRVVTGSPESFNMQQELTLRQGMASWRFSQQARLFTHERDAYYTGSGDIDGYRLRLGAQHVAPWGENGGGLVYRRAESSTDQMSEIVAFELSHRLALPGRGELRLSSELYRQWLNTAGASVSYTLTDNHDGSKGINWSASWRWQVKSGWRVTISLNGRHADNRSARIYGRSEVVAGF